MEENEDEIIQFQNNSKRKPKKDKLQGIQQKLLNFFKILFILIIILLILCFIYLIRKLSYNKNKIQENYNNFEQNFTYNNSLRKKEDEIINKTKDIITNINNNSNVTLNYNNSTNNTIKSESNRKLGIAFVYSSLFSNGIARFITVTAEYFLKTGKFDIYFITGKPYHKEFKFSKEIKRFEGHNNRTIIKNITKHYKIDFFILHNVLSSSTIKWYKSLGSKVIGMFHGNFMSAMWLNDPLTYKHWNQFDTLDAFIFICADDYYYYNSLNFTNHIFIPNLYTFEPSKIPNSNLTTHNIMMLGRENDRIKGATYAIEAMNLVIKEVPDALLNIVTSDSRIQFLKNLTRDLNLTNNVKILFHTYDISSHFYNSSVYLFTSLSEAFPMAMNEGKAHGMPIVAFDVPISPPYQQGVITVDSLDYVALAREIVKLLKDFEYRKKMGELSKLSLNMFSNNETVEMWIRLFDVLNQGEEKFREFQKEVQNKYYNKERAKVHIDKHFRDMQRYNSNFSCFTVENFSDPYLVSQLKTCSEFYKIKNMTVSNITKNN